MSRLTRTTHEKNKKQSIFFAVAIFVFIFVLFQFGPKILNQVGGFMSAFGNKDDGAIVVDKNTLETPFIVSIPEATNSATIVISGTSSYSDATIELYINGNRYDTAPLGSDQKFEFDDVTLREGSNVIKARTKKGNAVSEFTRNYTVVYGKEDAKLEVSSPSDGATFSRGDQTINVQGKTDPDSSIFVNGSKAIVDGEGNFSYYLNLSDGENTISIDAESAGGKRINKTIKVTYKP